MCIRDRITACAGVGIHEAVWAGILLMIFHAVSKSLMFLSVGAVENCTGSRNIEDMHGLIVKLPKLAFVMIVGIVGMFLDVYKRQEEFSTVLWVIN